MDQLQRNHVSDIKQMVCALIEKKYEKGADEHGGYIWDQTFHQLISNAIEELIDALVYLQTLEEKLDNVARGLVSNPDDIPDARILNKQHPQSNWQQEQDTPRQSER